jgi:hypothetical protein
MVVWMTENIISDGKCCQNSISEDVAAGIQKIFDLERQPTSLEDLNSLIQRSHEGKNKDLVILGYIGRYFIEKGVFPSLDLVAKEFGIELLQLNQIIKKFEDRGFMTFDKNGEINGAYGMSLSSTQHSFYFGDRAVNVWCAIDAMGIPMVLGIKAEVRSKCSHCSNKISIKIREKNLEEYKNDTVVFVGFSGEIEGKIIKDLCPYLNFFCSIEHLQEWKKNKPNVLGMSMGLPIATELSKMVFDMLA